MPTDAMGMLRRIRNQDGRMTAADWAALCTIVRKADEEEAERAALMPDKGA